MSTTVADWLGASSCTLPSFPPCMFALALSENLSGVCERFCSSFRYSSFLLVYTQQLLEYFLISWSEAQSNSRSWLSRMHPLRPHPLGIPFIYALHTTGHTIMFNSLENRFCWMVTHLLLGVSVLVVLTVLWSSLELQNMLVVVMDGHFLDFHSSPSITEAKSDVLAKTMRLP